MPVSVMKGYLLKVHNPSVRVKRVMWEVMQAYTHATAVVLRAAARDWPELRAEAAASGSGERISTLRMQTALNARYRRLIAPYPMHASLRDALFADVAAQVSSYEGLTRRWLAARARVRAQIGDTLPSAGPLPLQAERLLAELGAPPAWPTVPRPRADHAGYEGALDRLGTDGDTLSPPHVADTTPAADDRATRRVRWLRALLDVDPSPVSDGAATVEDNPTRLDSYLACGVVPLSFTRPDGVQGHRSFALLQAAGGCRYGALLYLLPNGDPRRRPLRVPDQRAPLVAIHPERPVLPTRERPSSAIRVDLEFGRWHVAAALAAAQREPAMVRTARLVHRRATTGSGRARHGSNWRDDEFYLALTVEHTYLDPREPATYLGVAMDQEACIAWCVIDRASGAVRAAGIEHDLSNLAERWRDDRRVQMRRGRDPAHVRHRQRAQVRQAMHIVVKRLVELAGKHVAQVGIVDPTYLNRGGVRAPRGPGGAREPRTAAAREADALRRYRRATLIGGRLAATMAYTLPRVAVPRPLVLRGISPRDCPRCGHRTPKHEGGIGAPERCGQCDVVLDVAATAQVAAIRVPEALARRGQGGSPGAAASTPLPAPDPGLDDEDGSGVW